MKGQALLQLSTVSIQFNEEKSDNPFLGIPNESPILSRLTPSAFSSNLPTARS